MKTREGIFGFLHSRDIEVVEDPAFNEAEFEKCLEDIFRVSERPPAMVILRGVFYDLKKPKEKEKAARIFKQMLEKLVGG